jgi:hypothetical protein
MTMVNVTLGEVKPQERPFPKLMTNGSWVGYFIQDGQCVWLTGSWRGYYADNVNMHDIVDYNEPITLQNA